MADLEKFGIKRKETTPEEMAVYSMTFCYSMIEKEIENCLKPFELSIAKFNTLLIIKHQGGEAGISQVEIGKRLIVTASNMTKLLDRMEKEGMIERSARSGDRRVNIVKITQKASDLLEQAWEPYMETIKKLTGLLNKNELEEITNLSLKWFKQLQKG